MATLWSSFVVKYNQEHICGVWYILQLNTNLCGEIIHSDEMITPSVPLS